MLVPAVVSSRPRPAEVKGVQQLCSPSPQPVACRRSDNSRCPETLSVDVVAHSDPKLPWEALHSTLPPLVTERHPQGGQPLDLVGAMGSIAAAPDGSVCSTLWSLHQFVNASRPPMTPTKPQILPFRCSTLLQYMAQGPVAAAARGQPHLTVFMHVCHDRHATLSYPAMPCSVLPCPVLSCPALRLAPPGSSSASGLN